MTLIKNLDFKSISIYIYLFLLMTLTRGSHLLSSLSLPDASFALFLIGGMLLKKPKWFISLFMLSVAIDLATLSINSAYQIPINFSYWGLLPSYGIMWFFGLHIANTKSFLKFTAFGVIATLITFVISTQTYNLLSLVYILISLSKKVCKQDGNICRKALSIR
jgi:hypothetical protein